VGARASGPHPQGEGKPGFPPPSLPPLGGGARFPPPAGAGEGGGGLRRRALPAQTLPPGERTGKPGFPSPLRTGCARTFPGAWVRGPPARIRKEGEGETRVPPTPA